MLPSLLAIAVAAGCGGAYRNYPRWVLGERGPHRWGCADVQAFVRVSGKTGIGVTLAVRSHETCKVKVVEARWNIGSARAPGDLPPEQTLPGRSLVYLWIPFPFDNEGLWNEGQRTGELHLALETNGVHGETWIIPATHGWPDGRWKPWSRYDR